MDVISDSWFSDLLQGMDDPVFMIDQLMDKFDEDLVASLGDEFPISLSSESNNSQSTLIQTSNSTNTLCGLTGTATADAMETPPPQTVINGGTTTTTTITGERPSKQRKRNNNSMTSQLNQGSSTPVILSFSNSSILTENVPGFGKLMTGSGEEVQEASPKVTQPTVKKSGSRIRPPSQTYDHIIAERKRREQLSQLFVALSALVPGLKKMDKTSVLGDAIKYLKQLQERVKKLEEQTARQNMESVLLVKKSQLLVDDDDGDEGEGSSDENPLGSCDNSEPLPEIGASVCGRSILLRIHCERQKGILVKILAEIENMNLSVANTSVAQFGGLALDITIIAEMEKEFSLTVKDVVRKIRTAMRQT